MLGLLTVALLSAPSCRASPPAEGAIRSSRDVDGDGVPDKLDGTARESVTLTLSKTGVKVEAHTMASAYSMLSVTAVPGPLVDNAAARGFVEEALFERVCDGPDPSLEWLLDDAHRLRWYDGPPAMPQWYALVSTAPKLLAAARDEPTSDEEAPRAAWVFYLGGTHRYSTPGQLGLAEPRLLARRGSRALLGTAHGVLLSDEAKKRYAWIYVFRGGDKLRFSSIARARFAGGEAVIDLTQPVGGTRGQVRVDLATGRLLEDWSPH